MVTRKQSILLGLVGLALGGIMTNRAWAVPRSLADTIDQINVAYKALDETMMFVKEVTLAYEKERAVYQELRSLYAKTRDPKIASLIAESEARLSALQAELGRANARVTGLQTQITAMLGHAQFLAAAQVKNLTAMIFEEQAVYDTLKKEYERTRNPKILALMKESAQRLEAIVKDLIEVELLAKWIDAKIREASQWGMRLGT